MSDAFADKVVATLAEVKRIPAGGITMSSSLQELGVDSLDTFTLLFELESKFNISIPDEKARSIRTVGDIVDGVRKIVESASAGASLQSPASAD